MGGDVLGAVIVLSLCGLVFPITLLLAAAALDALVVAWALFQGWHDRAWPATVLWWQEAMRTTMVGRLHPHW